MLSFYARQVSEVEINNTSTVSQEHGSRSGHPGARDVLRRDQGDQRITHHAVSRRNARVRSSSCSDDHAWHHRRSVSTAAEPEKDAPRLSLSGDLPRPNTRSSFGTTWFDDETFDALRARDIAMCVSEHRSSRRRCLDRGVGICAATRSLQRGPTRGVARQIAAQPWSEAYVYLNTTRAQARDRLRSRRSRGIRSAHDRLTVPIPAITPGVRPPDDLRTWKLCPRLRPFLCQGAVPSRGRVHERRCAERSRVR